MMKNRGLLSMIALILLVLPICFASSPVVNNTPNFNEVQFEYLIHRALKGEVKGYSVVVGNKDGIQAKVSGGWAQLPDDGNVPMKTHVVTGIGSTIKTVSAVALLNIFSRHIYSGRSVQDQLDFKILPKLPRKWRSEFSNTDVAKITYRHLLQHKSGIDKNEAAVERAEAAGFQYAKGFYHYLNLKFAFNAGDLGQKREYENTNIGLLVWLIPALAYPNDVKAIQDRFDSISNPKEYSQKMIVEYSKLYEKYMRTHIFNRVSPSMNPVYKPTSGIKYAKSYAAYSNTSVTINEPYAAAQGGWMMSGQDFANFVRTFYFTNTFFGPVTRNSLYVDDSKATRDDRIVFSNSRKDTRFSDATDYYPGHNGAEEYYKTTFSILPHGYYAIVSVNSPIYETVNGERDDITNSFTKDLLFDAFYEATREKPFAGTFHGITEATYQQYVNDLTPHGSRVSYADFFEVDRKLYVNASFQPGSYNNWIVKHNMSSNTYNTTFNSHVQNGYRPVQVESYKKNGQVRYAYIMKRANTSNPSSHRLSPQEFRDRMDDLRDDGYEPMSVSALQLGNSRDYTMIARSQKYDWTVRGFVRMEDMKSLILQMSTQGYRPTYLSAYTFNRNSYCSVIFKSVNYERIFFEDGMGSVRFNKTDKEYKQRGYKLKCVTGYAEGRKDRYAAIWIKK